MNTVYYAIEMEFENRKIVFKYLLRSIFLDKSAIDLESDKLVDFYAFLMDEFKKFSEQKAERNESTFFLIETIISILASFHIMDKSFLTTIVMHPSSMESYLKMDSITPIGIYSSNTEFNLALSDVRNLYFYLKNQYFS